MVKNHICITSRKNDAALLYAKCFETKMKYVKKRFVKRLLTWMTLVGVAPRFHILFVTHDKTKLTQTRTAGDARKWWQLCFLRTLATTKPRAAVSGSCALF